MALRRNFQSTFRSPYARIGRVHRAFVEWLLLVSRRTSEHTAMRPEIILTNCNEEAP